MRKTGHSRLATRKFCKLWDAIKVLNQALVVSAEEKESLRRCAKAIETALDTYALISLQAVALNSKSGNSHLEELDGALRLFKRLAELAQFDCLVSCFQISSRALVWSEVFCDHVGVRIKTPQSDIQGLEEFQTLRGLIDNVSGKDND